MDLDSIAEIMARLWDALGKLQLDRGRLAQDMGRVQKLSGSPGNNVV